jgi:hypothetical protein
MTTVLYEIETSEADDGTTVPAEGIWTPEEPVRVRPVVVRSYGIPARIADARASGTAPDE